MEVAHRLLTYATVAAVALGIVWSLVLVRRPRSDDRVFDRLQFTVVGLALVTAVAGVAILVSGGRPREDLHLVYALIAIGLIPLARSFVAERGRRQSVVFFLAFVVLGGVLYRLFTTG